MASEIGPYTSHQDEELVTAQSPRDDATSYRAVVCEPVFDAPTGDYAPLGRGHVCIGKATLQTMDYQDRLRLPDGFATILGIEGCTMEYNQSVILAYMAAVMWAKNGTPPSQSEVQETASSIRRIMWQEAVDIQKVAKLPDFDNQPSTLAERDLYSHIHNALSPHHPQSVEAFATIVNPFGILLGVRVHVWIIGSCERVDELSISDAITPHTSSTDAYMLVHRGHAVAVAPKTGIPYRLLGCRDLPARGWQAWLKNATSRATREVQPFRCQLCCAPIAHSADELLLRDPHVNPFNALAMFLGNRVEWLTFRSCYVRVSGQR